MDENPYKTPTEAAPHGPPFPILRWLAVGSGIGCALVFLALVAAFFALPLFVDIRENPRFWDEYHAREKAKREDEKTAP